MFPLNSSVQLVAVHSSPIACYMGEITETHFTTTSFWIAVESSKVSPKLLLLWTKQSLFLQVLLIRLVLQISHQLNCPSPNTLLGLSDL